VAVTSGPPGDVAVTNASLWNVSASMSACLIVYVPVNVVLSTAPTASVAIGSPLSITPPTVSDSVTSVKVWFPVLLTVNA